MAVGKSGAILDLLQELGTVPEDLQKRIRDEKDIETLQRWLKSAARASSITEFQIEIKNSSPGSEGKVFYYKDRNKKVLYKKE